MQSDIIPKILVNLSALRGLVMKIKLIKWSKDLSKELINICNNIDRSYLSNRIPYPYTEKDADFWFGMATEHDGKDGIFRAIVVDDKVVGNIAVEQNSDVRCKDSEIGYFLLTDNWSKGIMTEAVKQICKLAFDELDIVRISGTVYLPNTASQRVLEKNGFESEGVRKNAVYKDGKFYDLCLYGKLKQ